LNKAIIGINYLPPLINKKMRTLKRVLTRKSILGFGYSEYKDLPIQMILDLGLTNYLIKSYFNLEKIDFTEDILDELGITSEFRIVKPNKDIELGILFFKNRKNNLSDEDRIKDWRKNTSELKKRIIRNSNSSKLYNNNEYLRSKNHGNKLK
jgi:hypothetical protein